MKDYVYIQSTMNVMITAGLQNEDVTNKAAAISDRLRVNTTWHKTKMMIKTGKHLYPSCITTWNSVTALKNAGILTIGEEVDTTDDAELEKTKNELEAELKRQGKIVDISLENIAKSE